MTTCGDDDLAAAIGTTGVGCGVSLYIDADSLSHDHNAVSSRLIKM